MQQNEKNDSFRQRMMLGIVVICLLVQTSCTALGRSGNAPVMVAGADYYWSTNGQQRVLCLTKSGYMKIVELKIDWK